MHPNQAAIRRLKELEAITRRLTRLEKFLGVPGAGTDVPDKPAPEAEAPPPEAKHPKPATAGKG